MICNVVLRKSGENQYGGRPYSYETDLALKVGDIVVAPTVSGLNYAKVVRVDVPREEIDPRWRDKLREIVDMAPEKETDCHVADAPRNDMGGEVDG